MILNKEHINGQFSTKFGKVRVYIFKEQKCPGMFLKLGWDVSNLILVTCPQILILRGSRYFGSKSLDNNVLILAV